MSAILILGGWGSGTAHAFAVNDVRFGAHPDKVRLVIDLSAPQAFRAQTQTGTQTGTQAAQNRLIIDMPRFDWRVGNVGGAQGATVKSIRQGELQPGISRIVIDFLHPIKIHNAYTLPRDTAHNKPDRLVVDFQRVSAEEAAEAAPRIFGKLPVATPSMADSTKTNSAKTTAHSAPASAAIPVEASAIETPLKNTAAPLQTAALTPDKKPTFDAPLKAPAHHKKPLIVIDAGHGGVDPGALGANGVSEKHVTLSMAKTLKEQLETTGRYRVILTRERDTYLKLYKRVEFARKHNADLFISLHADSIGKSNVAGASLYTLSDKASDEQTALLADRENRADLIAGMDLDTNDEQVATILVDLTMRDTMNQSKFFANKLVGHLQNGNIRMLDNPHRFAGFAVLKAPDVPSVLIEMGFMSNPREAEQLNKPEYRRNFAKTLVHGIDNYFAKLAQMQRS